MLTLVTEDHINHVMMSCVCHTATVVQVLLGFSVGTVDCGQTVAIILRLVQDGSTVLSTTEEVINP